MNQPYAQGVYRAGHYPYPPSYSYYPTRSYPYQVRRQDLVYPAVFIIAGLLLVAFSFMRLEKIDPEISRLAQISPDREIAAIVFCDPCSAVEGDSVGGGKVFVVGRAVEVYQMASLPGVKQVRLVEKL
jgi:hypothetical protein